MAKREKIYMPMGTGGLIRYAEEERETLKLKPEHVIWFVIFVIVFELILKFIG